LDRLGINVLCLQAKENADEFMGQKLELDNQKKEQQKTVDDTEKAMKLKAASVGNLIYKDVPISDNEVCIYPYILDPTSPGDAHH
jgi:seryl-tRNA synthetase